MTGFSRAARVARGGIVLLAPTTGQVLRVIVLQFNPDRVSRTLQPRGAGEQAGYRLEALRLTGPPQETISLEEVELDATEQLEHPDQHQGVARLGLLPVLAALETLVYPTTGDLVFNDVLARLGTIEITPIEAPLSVFVWNRSRVLPVRITEMGVTEEAFDSSLNPIRATLRLGMRVLTVDDLGFLHPGGVLSLLHQRQKEALAALHVGPALGALGLTRLVGG